MENPGHGLVPGEYGVLWMGDAGVRENQKASGPTCVDVDAF